MISGLATISEGIGGQVTFSVVDNPGLSSIDLRDPASDAILYRRVIDFPGNVTADGKHHYTFTITFSDIQAAWSKDGHTDALPATVKLVVWGSDGMPENANMTKVNWSGDDNRRCEVCEAGCECACSRSAARSRTDGRLGDGLGRLVVPQR